MALKIPTTFPEENVKLTEDPLPVTELQIFADTITQNVERYRPEYTNIIHLQRNAGCRITELFQPERWSFPTTGNVQIRPQKGNATRVVSLSDLGFASVVEMAPVLADMQRLPKGQYERAFSRAVHEAGLWRLYDSGFTHPSTHFFRHLKIKLLKSENFDLEYIANWIGEKNIDNLNYYLNSKYFAEIF